MNEQDPASTPTGERKEGNSLPAPGAKGTQDHNELFAWLIVANGFVDSHVVDDARRHATDASMSLAELLVESGELSQENRRTIEALVEQCLCGHNDDQHLEAAAIEETISFATPVTEIHVGDSGPSAKTFADYELLEEIAKGGMGVVFKARQTKLNRLVALKMIRSGEFADNEQVQRFYSEAQAAAKLDHPGIVPVFEVGEANGQHFYSMAFVEGESLHARVKVLGPFDARPAAILVKAVAEAIQFAHDNGIVHRDLKPQNIMIDRGGIPKVTDFGLAKHIQDGSELTETGQVLGTPSYMPPEQASGKTGEIGVAADVYSLGAILYYLLTGRPPFQAASMMQTLRQVIEQEPVAPRRLNSEVDANLETICLKCLQKDPGHRFRNARELSEDLRRFLEGRPIHARPAGSIERTYKWIHRNPRLASALATGIAAIVWAGLWFAGNRYQRVLEVKNDEITRINSTLKRTVEQRDQSLDRERGLRTDLADANSKLDSLLYVRRVGNAYAEYQDGHVVHARELLAACPVGLRGWEWKYVWTLCHPERFRLAGHQWFVSEVAFSPDGKLLVSGSGDRTLKVWDTQTGRELGTLNGHADRVTSVVFHPDGDRIASGSANGMVRIWNVGSREEIHRWKASSEYIYQLAFRPDGRQLAVAGRDGAIQLWEMNTHQLVTRLVGHERYVTSVAYSHDGKKIASGGFDRTVRLWDSVEGGEIWKTEGHRAMIGRVVFTPDDQEIVSASTDSSLKVWDVTQGNLVRTLTGHQSIVRDMAVSADGKWAVSGCDDRTIRTWDLSTGNAMITLKGHQSPVRSVAISPDGRNIVSGSGDRDGLIMVWDVEDARAQQTAKLNGHSNFVIASRFLPDSQHAVSLARDGTVRLWNVPSRSPPRTIIRDQNILSDLAVSRNGKLLATGGFGRVVKVWDAMAGREISSFHGHEDAITAVAFGSNGIRLASAGMGPDSPIYIWNLAESETPPMKLKGHVGPVWDVAFSPDGYRLVSAGGDATVRVWDVSTGTQTQLLVGHTDEVRGIAVTQNGRHIVSGGFDRTVRIWDTATGKQKRILKHSSRVISVCISSDGTRAVGAGYDGIIKLWDTETGHETITLHGHSHIVNTVDFSPDGLQLLSGGGVNGNPGELRLWQVSHRAEEAADSPKDTPSRSRFGTVETKGTPERSKSGTKDNLSVN